MSLAGFRQGQEVASRQGLEVAFPRGQAAGFRQGQEVASPRAHVVDCLPDRARGLTQRGPSKSDL